MGHSAPDGCRLIGREPEVESLTGLFGPRATASALVFSGGPGIGKTALWEAGLRIAQESGFRVLAARPSEAEAQQPFAALIDLLENVGADILNELPTPQRRALEAALLRPEPVDGGPEPLALGVALLGALRSMMARTPLLVANKQIARQLFIAEHRSGAPGSRLRQAWRPVPHSTR